jgi:pimeloyl-ACP methyl ester carboxylesterase
MFDRNPVPHTFSYLINEKVTVNGKQIFCKVTGLPNSAKDNQPYVLVIAGGPGFSHELTELTFKRLIPIADKNKSRLPHFIFFDNLGCGESDKAIDHDKEYTIDFFTDLSVALVQVVKGKLGLLISITMGPLSHHLNGTTRLAS